MMKFGFCSTDLDRVAGELGPLLRVSFRLHESYLRGGAYYRAETPAGILGLQTNYDKIDEEAFENEWPERQIILYMDGLDDTAWAGFAKEIQASAGPLGATYLGHTGPIAHDHQQALLASLSEEEQQQLAALLQRIADQQGLTPRVHPGYKEQKRESGKSADASKLP